MDSLLEVRNVLYRYPGSEQPAVQHINFTVRSGEIYGLLGPNGAGKSTTIAILSTLMQPTSGEIKVAGLNLWSHVRQVRSLIGLVPQEIALYPELSARENLMYFAQLHGLHGRTLRDRVDECLSLVGLKSAADRKVTEYSGGMARRANLAVGIVHHPRLLFLDEPTVGIDAQSRRMILDNLLRLNQEGMTMLYTTHYMEEVQQICCRLAIMDQGRILVEGTLAELLADYDNCENLEDLFLSLTGKELRD